MTTPVSAPKIDAENDVKVKHPYKEMPESRKNILDYMRNEFNKYIETWSTNHSSEGYTGGEMRENRGSSTEDLVKKTIDKIAVELNINLTSKKGSDDIKLLTLPRPNGTNVTKKHQVDVHVYLNANFIAVIECKSYLDSCYYVRACDDFNLFKRFGYDVKTLIFALEDSISEDTKMFTDVSTDNACDRVFYILDGKRSSSKPIYDKRYLKTPNDDKIVEFIDYICDLITMKSE